MAESSLVDHVTAEEPPKVGEADVVSPASETSEGPSAPRRRSRSRLRGAPLEGGSQPEAGPSSRGAAEPPAADAARPQSEAGPQSEPTAPKAPVCAFAAQLSDRAIQRITGGNAFLRGRIYARRNSVEALESHDDWAAGQISVCNADEPYKMRFELDPEHKVRSSCTCPGWRGPTGHCKHVAALLVSLRNRERPPRPKPDQSKKQNGRAQASAPVHVPQTVSVGGKRRRSRRRRRGGGGESSLSKIEVMVARDLPGSPSPQERGSLDVWLPHDVLPKPYELEYRMTVRSAAITVTPVVAGTRSAVPIVEALAAFNVVSTSERGVLRALARHATRGRPATSELRGEDAAELLTQMRGRRVLLEPASMELRVSDEALRPTIDLDLANPGSVRVRVIFELPGSSRRFLLSNGVWFEGTPGWHVDTIEGVARPLADAVTPAWLQRLYRSPVLVHPMSDLPRLLTDYIPRVAASLGAELPDLSSVADLVDAQPAFQIKADGDIVEARVRLQVSYRDQTYDVPPGAFPSPLAFLPPLRDGGRPRVVRRDVGREMAAVQLLMNLGFEVAESGDELTAAGDTAVAFWTEGIGSLPEEWDRFIPDDLVDVTIRSDTVTPQLRVSSGVDWLSLDLSFDSGGVAVDDKELRLCLEKNRRLVKLADGTYAPLRHEQVSAVMARLADICAKSGEQKRLPLSQAGRVQELLGLVERKKVTPKAKELFGKLEDVGAIEKIAKPRTLKAKLRDYQKRGFNWLVFMDKLGSGCVLADDMGLGKTVQAIALLLWSKANSKKQRPNLVVAPTSVVPNWQLEIAKFAPSLTTLIWQGPHRHDLLEDIPGTNVVITSYALLRRDEELLQGLDLGYVILDEAQHIKNPVSATARAAKRLPSHRRLAMTGTPIENRLSEFWSILDFVSPGLLGNLKHFEERVARPIDRGDEDTAAKLRATVRPFVLRRTKAEVAPELPEKIEQEIVVPLAEEQSSLYKQILRQVRKSLMSEVEKQGVNKAQIQILAALTRLRQVACDPRLLHLPGTDWGDDESGKLGALREIVQQAIAGGHRLLIFSQFVQMLKIIRAALDEDGVTYEYLDGSTKDRMERVQRFNNDDSVGAFLISLKAGGTGLNLVGADTVVHFDPWWNPAVEDQATDRAHRIGQTRNVSVYKLIARGTVEEKILQLSAKKRRLVENVLSTEGSPIKGLTRADIDDLFSE